MTKQILEKVMSGGILDAKDVTADDKKALYAALTQFGMSQSTAYLRLFSKGFRQWELLGVSTLRNEFLVTAVCPSENEEIADEGSRGFAYVMSLKDEYDDSKFYSLVTDLKLGCQLCDFMSKRGMSSQMTVRSRFKANDFKPWEIIGVRSLLTDYFNANR